jgi:hypothetical protein
MVQDEHGYDCNGCGRYFSNMIMEVYLEDAKKFQSGAVAEGHDDNIKRARQFDDSAHQVTATGAACPGGLAEHEKG